MNQEVTIDAIYEPKADKNQDYVTVQARAIIARPSNLSGTAKLYVKGGDFTENRVAFFSIHRDIAKEMKFAVGADISTLSGEPQSIQITELNDSDYQLLDADGKRGFNAKLNPETKAMCLNAGEQVWRKSDLVLDAEFSDTLLVTDKVEATIAIKV